MALGPVQLVVVGLHLHGEDDDFKGKVLQALRAALDMGGAHPHEFVRVLDMLMIRKDVHGDIQPLRVSELGVDERERVFAGTLVSNLMGLRAGGDAASKPGASYRVLTIARHEFGLSEADLREIVRNIPNGDAAAIVLVEHLWVTRLKEALEDTGCALFAAGMLTSGALSAFGADVAIAQTAADNHVAH